MKLSLLGALVLVLAACASQKPQPKLASPDAMSSPAPEIAAPQAEDVDMTYTPKDAVAAGHDAPVTSVKPKNAAAQGKAH